MASNINSKTSSLIQFYENDPKVSYRPYTAEPTIDNIIVIELPKDEECPIEAQTIQELAAIALSQKPPHPYLLALVQDKSGNACYSDAHSVTKHFFINGFRSPKNRELCEKVRYFIKKSPDGPFSHITTCTDVITNETQDYVHACSLEKNEIALAARKRLIPTLSKEDRFPFLEIIRHNHPNDPFPYSYLPELLQYEKNEIPSYTKQTYDILLKASTFNLNDPFIYAHLGAILRVGCSDVPKNKLQALRYLNRALELDPHNYVAIENKVFYLVSKNSPYVHVTKDYLERLLKVNPTHAFAQLHLGKILKNGSDLEFGFLAKDEKSAKALLEEAAKTYPEAYSELAELSLSENNQPQAIALFQKVLEAQPTHFAACKYLGEIYRTGTEGVKQDREKAFSLFQIAYKANPQDAFVLSRIGELLREGGKTFKQNSLKAKAFFNNALSYSKNDVFALSRLGELLRCGGEGLASNERSAMRLFQNALIHDPKNSYARSHLAELLRTCGKNIPQDIDQAQKLFEQVLNEKPTDCFSLTNLAKIYKTKEDSRVLNLYQRLLEVDPTNTDPLKSLALLYIYGSSFTQKDFKLARKHLEEAIAINKTDPLLHGLLGEIYRKGGFGVEKDLKLAKRCYTTAITYQAEHPALSFIWYQLGQLHKNEPKKAQHFYEKALTINPHHKKAASRLKNYPTM
ncbi:MAG: hypothetical protein JWO53_1125 [Chlamydiia bacterium]|nr:hypothetical protein [Chlamydiia bacterium]